MLRLILAFIGFFGKIVARIIDKRVKLKPAREILPPESPTAQAVGETEAKAEEKFGPRLAGRPHQPVKRTVEGPPREIVQSPPKP